MTLRDHLDRTRDPKRLPNRPNVDRPVRVGSAYSQIVKVEGAPRTYLLPSARPGRNPRSATLVGGAQGVVRVVGDAVFFDASENGDAILEVLY